MPLTQNRDLFVHRFPKTNSRTDRVAAFAGRIVDMQEPGRDELPPHIRRYAPWRWDNDEWTAIGFPLLWCVFMAGVVISVCWQITVEYDLFP